MFFRSKPKDLVCQECGGVAVKGRDIQEHDERSCLSCGTPGLVRYLGTRQSPEGEVEPPEPYFLTGREARRYRLSPERVAEQRAEVEWVISSGMLPAPG